VHRRVVGKLPRETVSLAAGAKPEDDGIQDGPLVYERASGLLGWVILVQARADPLPQLVRHEPGCREGLLFGCGRATFGHLHASSSGVSPMIADSEGFEIIT
jgi:hypothetical protein